MTGYELQYISTTDGAFDSVLAANMTSTSVIESKFLITSFYYGRPVYFGVDYADTCVRVSEKDMYMCSLSNISISSYLTLNEEHTAYFSPTEYRWNGSKIADVTGTVAIPSSPRFRSQISGNLYYFKITDNGVDKVNLVAWQDGNGNLGLYDKVNDVFYTPSSGTWTAGPLAHVFESDKASLRFEASGGTDTLEITAETGWTCTTPTAFTMSTTTGTTGTTTITVTAPANTGSTKIEEIITFTDADNYTFDVKLRQKVEGVGFSYLQIGEDTIDTFYIGDLQIEALYMGEEQIYGSGPFVGLKASPKTLALNNLNPTANITIRSSENWTITDNSSGGHYVLYNWTSNCPSFTATYDGSIDYLVPANPVGNGTDSIWEEWDSSNSMSKQDFIDLCASHGITLDGMNCDSSGYRIELRPVAGGSKWLSYSQTSGGSGKTVVTVTASTTQADRTATITVTTANYSGTIDVTDKALIMPLNEVWYKTVSNESLPLRSGAYYIDSNGNQLTYTESFDSVSGLWKMTFNGNVYGNNGALYYHHYSDDRLVELWLPYGYVRPNDIFIYGQRKFEKFKGDSPAIVDNGNAVVCLVQDSTNMKDFVIQGVKSGATTITIPEGVVGLCAYSFRSVKVTTLNLPSTLAKINAFSFENSEIATMNCYATICPTLEDGIFYGVSNNGTLHYPTGSDYSNFTIPSNWTKVGDL